jgi:hypothetical protein
MNDPDHLYEADKIRIQNEAKVRTAMEDPDFARREFERWQEARQARFKRDDEIQGRDEESYYVNAWAKVAWLAEGRELRMGRELEKLQQRIGRQRKTNRDQHRALRQLKERVKNLEDTLSLYAEPSNWEAGNEWKEDGEGHLLAQSVLSFRQGGADDKKNE